MRKISTNHHLIDLCEYLLPLRRQLMEHEVYRSIETLDDLRIFMGHHVFAVWDFMSLLKALQRQLTCVGNPWIPRGDPLSRRLINEIVLAEESDEVGPGEYTSHFEMYRLAMIQSGADISCLDEFMNRLQLGEDVILALDRACVPMAARKFVTATFVVINSGSLHRVAGAFTFGREGVIPNMFRILVSNLKERFSGRLNLLENYLVRHIDLDENYHCPMTYRLLELLCGDDENRWREVKETAGDVLKDRIALWDDVAETIRLIRNNQAQNKMKASA